MIPTYQEILRPLLEVLDKNNQLSLEQCSNIMAEKFSLTPEERVSRLKKGNQTVIKNRTGWAKFYLEKAGLVETLKRGVYTITKFGRIP